MHFFNTILDSYNNRYDPNMARKITDLLWYGSIRLSFVLLVSALLLGGWLLWDATGAATTKDTTRGSVETVSRVQLDNALGTFTNRGLQYDAIKKGGASIVDPGR